MSIDMFIDPDADPRVDPPPHFSSRADPDGDFDGAAPDPDLVAEAWDVRPPQRPRRPPPRAHRGRVGQ